MASKVDICNQALAHCHSSVVISNFTTDTGKGPVLLRRFYDVALTETLEAVDWGFAHDEAALAVVSGEEVAEWTYCYGLPANCVKVRRIINLADRTKPIPFEIRLQSSGTETMIVSNEYTPTVSFTKLVTTTTLWPAHFTSALACNLAEKIVGPLTDDYKRKEQIGMWYERLLQRAMRIERSQEEVSEAERQPQASWIEART